MMTAEMIQMHENAGFKRWTKGSFDRLYIDAATLGLCVDMYKTGNISSATFKGKKISNSLAKEILASKVFVDVTSGKLNTSGCCYTMQVAAEEFYEEFMEVVHEKLDA